MLHGRGGAHIATAEQGAREIADWYLARPDWQVVDEREDALMDKLAADFGVA